MPECLHRVQLMDRKAVVGELCKVRARCTGCRRVFTHTFTGEQAKEMAKAWYFVPPGLPPPRQGRKAMTEH